MNSQYPDVEPQNAGSGSEGRMEQMESDLQALRQELGQVEAANQDLQSKYSEVEKSGRHHSYAGENPSPTPSPEARRSSVEYTEELEKAGLAGKELPRVRDYSTLYYMSPFRLIDPKFKFRNPYIVAAISTMGGLLFGAAGSNMTPFIGLKGYNTVYGNIPGIQQGGVSAAFPGGAFVGSVISGYVGDSFGRKNMICLGAVTWIIGAVIQVASAAIPSKFETGSRAALSIGRIIMGICVGFASSNVPLYLQELSPPNIRGRLAVCFQLSECVGILVMYEIAWGCSNMTAHDGRSGLELAWGLMMVPGAIWLVGSFFLPESPRWLANMGDWTKCVEVLTFLRGEDAESQIVKTELQEYEKAIKEETEKRTGFSDLFKGHSFGRTIACLSVMANQQLIGTNIVLFYAGSIIRMSNYSNIDVFRFTTVWYAVNLGMTLPPTFWIDRWSRRWVFIGGALGMCTCMCITAGLMGKYGVPTPGDNGYCTNYDDPSTCDGTIRQYVPYKPAGKAALAFSIIFFGIFAIGWGPVAWVYCSEIFPPSQRSVGNSLGSAINWLFNFAITVSCPAGFINIQWRTYVIYAVFGMVAAIFTFFFVPETLGYSLDEMDAMIKRGVSPWKSDPVYLWFKGMKKNN